MFCGKCGGPVNGSERFCKQCGAQANQSAAGAHPSAPPQPAQYGSARPRKSKSTYQLLGLLLGFFGFPGIHNFYAGYTGKALAQILMTVLSCWILWIAAFIWTIVDICTVETDSEGQPFE